MKKFRFTLEKLLRYKESILDKEKNTLAAIRAQLNKVRDQIEYMERARDALRRKMKEDAARGTTAFEIQTAQFQVENIGYQMESLRDECGKLEKMAEAQLHTVIELTKEKAELESLREKQLEEFNREEAKENELVISEFVSGGIIRKSRAG